MDCPVCAEAMVNLSTVQGAWIWTCPNKHGLLVHVLDLWRFVEDYDAYYQALEKADLARRPLATMKCPDCLSPLQSFPLYGLGILTCSSCKWKWLPEGKLTAVHRRYAKTNDSTFDEECLYKESRQPSNPFGMRIDRSVRDWLETPFALCFRSLSLLLEFSYIWWTGIRTHFFCSLQSSYSDLP